FAAQPPDIPEPTTIASYSFVDVDIEARPLPEPPSCSREGFRRVKAMRRATSIRQIALDLAAKDVIRIGRIEENRRQRDDRADQHEELRVPMRRGLPVRDLV